MMRRTCTREPEPWNRKVTDVEYSVEDSCHTVKKSYPVSPENLNFDGLSDERRPMPASLVKAPSFSRFSRAASLPEPSESAVGLAKGSSMQGTTRIDNHGGNEELYSIDNEPRKQHSIRSILRLNSGMDSTKFLLMRKKTTKVSFQEMDSVPLSGQKYSVTLSSKPKLAGVSFQPLKRSASVDGRCPIDLTLKRSSLVKLDPHRGDQDLPYLLNKVGLLESQTSKPAFSLKKATLASLQQSWFGNKKAGLSKTTGGGYSPVDLNKHKYDLRRERLSIGQYTLKKLNETEEIRSQKYKRVNFFSGKFRDTLITTET